MATTTHRIAVTNEAFSNVSNGNLNCTLVNGNSALRMVVAGIEPEVDTVDCVMVSGGGVVMAHDLAAEDELWVRCEAPSTDVLVIRGPAKVSFAPN
jgi:hypothetical protein